VQQNEDYVLKVLQAVELVSRDQIEAARTRLDSQNSIVEALIKDNVVTEIDISRALARHAHMDWIDLSKIRIPPTVIEQISADDARRFNVVPAAFSETALVVAVSNPLDIDTIDSLGFLLQRELELVCSSPGKLREAQIKYYGPIDETADTNQKIGERVDFDLEIDDSSVIAGTDEADIPIIRLVSMLIIEAHRAGASDVHLEPLDNKLRVRLRIDGALSCNRLKPAPHFRR